jgi:hypothetical protein
MKKPLEVYAQDRQRRRYASTYPQVLKRIASVEAHFYQGIKE